MPGLTERAGARKGERLALAVYVAIVVGASAVPYAIAWRATPANRVYTGAYDATSDDLAPYLARMRAGARGEWIYRSPYAPGIGRTHTIRPSFTVLGAFCGLLGAPLWAGYHVARLLLGVLCLLVLFVVARSVSRSPLERWAAFVLASAGSGIGWITGRRGDVASWSYDLWVSEMNAAHSVITSPHFALSIVLMLACLAAFARSLERRSAGAAAWGGAAFAFLALDHPYDDVILGGALAAYGIVALATAQPPRRVLARSALVFVAVAAPAFAWELTSVATDPSLRSMGVDQPIGSILNVASGLGILPLLAVPGGMILARRSILGRILVAWCLVVPLLLALPVTFPRRFVAGWDVPLGMAAGLGLTRVLAPIRRRFLHGALLALILAFACVSTADVFAAKIRSASEPDLGYRTWLPREFLEAYAWLEAHAAPRAIVLGPYAFSNFMPVYADLCPYFGHWAEAPDGRTRRARVEEFYRPETGDDWRSRFLAEAGIDWVVAPVRGAAPGLVDLGSRAIAGLSPAGRIGFLEIYRVERMEIGTPASERPPDPN